MESTTRKSIHRRHRHHISHDKHNIHVHLDRFNIDFMRYYRFDRFILDVFGSCFGLLVWFFFLKEVLLLLALPVVYMLYVVFGLFFYTSTSGIVYSAGNSLFESLRIALRRMLFSFNTIMLMSLTTLILLGMVSWHDTFGTFLHVLLVTMMPAGIFAVLFDYVFLGLRDAFKRR